MTRKKTKLRSRPNQARSRATFDHVLKVAADLLEEVGWDGFNTNLLAERSGHRPAAIYRYFPNKLAIISTLAEQMVEEWDEWLSGVNERLEAGESIKSAWIYYARRFPEIVRALPGGIAVRRAMQASPILREIDQRDNERLAEGLADALVRSIPHLGQREAAAAARTLLESAVSVIDLAMDSKPAKARALLDEMVAMHKAYFDQLAGRQNRDHLEKDNV